MGAIGIRSSQAEMRLHKPGRFWRRGGNRNLARVPKSKLVKLEQEIGGVADRVAGNAIKRRLAGKRRGRIAAFFRGVGQDLVYLLRQAGVMAASARKVVVIGVRAAPEPRQPKTAAAPAAIPAKRAKAPGTSGVGLVLVSICFGLLILSGVIIALLFVQIKDMKGEIARWQQNLSATQSQLRQVEKAAQQKTESAIRAADARAQFGPIVLGKDEMKAIRASIKVLPPKPGAQAKIRVGEEVSDVRSAPVPESLSTQIPKLRGARFSIDDNGAIVLFAEGSNYVGAVIEPQ